jgi:hypothetical protein
MRTFLIAAFLLAAGTADMALALAERDVLGKWCGSEISYDISQKTLAVAWKSGGRRKKFVVERFVFTDTDVTMYWRRGARDRLGSTQFGEFSADRRVMIQMPNRAGPRRELKRCG